MDRSPLALERRDLEAQISPFVMLSIVRALKAKSPGMERVYAAPLLVQLMAPVVLGSGSSGQSWHLAGSAPGLCIFSQEVLKKCD